MKYRILTAEERPLFDEDFKYFLISNGVKNEEWEEMNEKEAEKAQNLVELFSDAVLDIVYKKIKYIEFRSAGSCLVFHCKDEEIEVISILPKKGASVDLSTPESIHKSLQNSATDLQIFQSKKTYSSERELEIHQMLEQGCVNSHKDFWDALLQAIDKK
jgi:hypothetical protein